MKDTKWLSVYNRLILNRLIYQIDDNDIHTQVHHILPRFAGGTDDQTNLVRLTYKEHRLAHLILTKIYQDTQFERNALDAAKLMNYNLRLKASKLGIKGSKSVIYDAMIRRWMKFNGRFIMFNG